MTERGLRQTARKELKPLVHQSVKKAEPLPVEPLDETTALANTDCSLERNLKPEYPAKACLDFQFLFGYFERYEYS